MPTFAEQNLAAALGRNWWLLLLRGLVRLDEAGIALPPELPRFANLLANFFFVLTVYLKAELDVVEVPYRSINYPTKM